MDRPNGVPAHPAGPTDLTWHAAHCETLLAHATPDAAARLLSAAGDYVNAARAAEHEEAEIEALSLMALAAQRSGQLRLAVECQQRELDLRARRGDRAGQAHCLNNIGMLHANLGAHADALAALHGCQQLCEQYQELPLELRGACNVNIAHSFLLMGEPAHALTFLNPGLEVARRCGDRQTELAALGILGLVHKDLRETALAEETLRGAIELARAHGETQHLIDLFDNLGQVYLELGQPEQATGMFSQSLYWAVDTGDVQGRVNALLSLGRAAFSRADTDGALAQLSAALAEARGHHLNASVRTILTALVEGLEAAGQPARAYPFLRDLRELERQVFSEDSERQVQSLRSQFEAERARREADTYRQLTEAAQQARLQAEETVRVRTAELEAVQIEIVTRLGMAAEYRDDRTGQHTRRVGELSAQLAQMLGLPPEEVDLIRWAARLHDIGKIGVGDDILLKTSPYTPDEFERMKLHTVIGAKVLEGSTSRLLRMAEEIARTHHERWDGRGYPRGLRGSGIPISGRIVAVADVFDALTSERPYKEAWTVPEALEEMQRGSGTQFDPDIVERLVRMVTSNQPTLQPLLAPRMHPDLHPAPPSPQLDVAARDEAQALTEQAWNLRQSDPKRGALIAPRALELARRSGDDLTLGRAQRTSGFYCFMAGAYEDALSHLSQGMDTGILCDDRALQADCANFMAAVYSNLQEYDRAADHLAVVLRIAREARDHLREAHALHNLSNLYYHARDLHKAMELVQEGLKLYRSLDHVSGLAFATSMQATVAFDLGDPELAAECAQAALLYAEQAGNVAVMNNARTTFGRATAQLGDMPRGIRLVRQAIEEAQQHDLTLQEAGHHFELGRLLHRDGQFTEARACYGRALELAGPISARDIIMQTFLQLSELSAAEGDPQTALDLYRRHHDVEREIHDLASALKTRALMTQLEVERVKSEAQIYRLRTIELATANEALERVNTEKSGLVNMLEEQSRLLERQLSEDGLTGLFNRRHVEGVLQHEFLHGRLTHAPLCVAMADIDHFKQVNDQFSHLVGDQVLRTVAALFQSAVRPSDSVGRYGGEEFLFVFPNTTTEHGQRICERVRELVNSYDWSQIHPALSVTLSMGVATNPRVPNHERLVSLADEQLYRAKRSGRNRVCVLPEGAGD
ncbi:diguanylate cyclase [Deinococcus depolymerans]|uniref:Diguanylate cyclase n=1 Tax=Deinococcus depolymerans TaxID=392408 RepID=A0ABP3LF98_9DEIO